MVHTLLEQTPMCETGSTYTPRFIIVFDREAYSPSFFGRLWRKHRVAVITYRKNVKDRWPESDFNYRTVETEEAETTMSLAEKPTALDNVAVREIRRLSKNGNQTSILTTNLILKVTQIAIYMASRWSQENFFC